MAAPKCPNKKYAGLPSYKNRAKYMAAWRKLAGKNCKRKPRLRQPDSEIPLESGLSKYVDWLANYDCGGMTERYI